MASLLLSTMLEPASRGDQVCSYSITYRLKHYLSVHLLNEHCATVRPTVCSVF